MSIGEFILAASRVAPIRLKMLCEWAKTQGMHPENVKQAALELNQQGKVDLLHDLLYGMPLRDNPLIVYTP